MVDVGSLIIKAFEELTPDIDSIYDSSHEYSLEDWRVIQKSMVTASGAGAALIPVAHLVTISADIVFLMNRMSTASYGIGSIHGYNNGFGNILEEEDFASILGVWCGEVDLKTSLTGKLAADLSAKVHSKVAVKFISKSLVKSSGLIAGATIGKKLGGKSGFKLGQKLATKLASKFGGKLASKIIGGFVPLFGAGLGAGINYFFIDTIIDSADEYYRFKIGVAKEL